MPHKPFHRKNVKKKSTVTSVSDLKKKVAENKRKKIEDNNVDSMPTQIRPKLIEILSIWDDL